MGGGEHRHLVHNTRLRTSLVPLSGTLEYAVSPHPPLAPWPSLIGTRGCHFSKAKSSSQLERRKKDVKFLMSKGFLKSYCPRKKGNDFKTTCFSKREKSSLNQKRDRERKIIRCHKVSEKEPRTYPRTGPKGRGRCPRAILALIWWGLED